MSTTDAALPDVQAPEFFAALEAAPQPLLTGVRGTLRFDVVRGDTTSPWHVRIDDGDVTVSRQENPADAVVRVNEPLFDEIVTGRANALAAGLRGEISFEGSPQLLTIFQRLFPGPPK